MDIYEFAGKYLQPYKVKEDEIIPQFCPICQGGAHHDKYTFALNVQKRTYNCRRGSCAAQGTFTELCRRFGEMPDTEPYKNSHRAHRAHSEPFKQLKQYSKPSEPSKPLTDAVTAYMAKRGISKATLDRCHVLSDGEGNIKFDFFDENKEHVFTKYRPARKTQKGERKSWRDKGTKPILYLMDLCDTTKPLIITEGEIDCLSIIECGIPNAVSVPSGAQDLTFLDTCYDWLENFNEIILFGDNDKPGRQLVRELTNRLGEYRIAIVTAEAYKDCKDANELLYRYGEEAIAEAIGSAVHVPIAGLLNLSDVTPFNPSTAERVSSGISQLDKSLGGFFMGQLTVWSGRRGEGKSTILGQMLLEAIKSGFNVCAYSGELSAQHFQFWIDLQAAGSENVTFVTDTLTGEKIPALPDRVRNNIHEWYRDKAYLYDNSIAESSEADSVIQLFEYAVKRYNCRVFMVDNLMSVRYDDGNDFYRKQSIFCGRLVEFAKKYNVHVHLVAHPRKTADRLSNDDISGSADITNRADNVITMTRLDVRQQNELHCDTVLEVIKNRMFGRKSEIALRFNPTCRRFCIAKGADHCEYGWNKPWEDYNADSTVQTEVTADEEAEKQ